MKLSRAMMALVAGSALAIATLPAQAAISQLNAIDALTTVERLTEQIREHLTLDRASSDNVTWAALAKRQTLIVLDNAEDCTTPKAYAQRLATLDLAGGTRALMTSRVENLSLADPKVWPSTVVSVGYDSDVDEVVRILEQCALVSPRVLKDPAPGARLAKFGADGLERTRMQHGRQRLRACGIAQWHISLDSFDGRRIAGNAGRSCGARQHCGQRWRLRGSHFRRQPGPCD